MSASVKINNVCKEFIAGSSRRGIPTVHRVLDNISLDINPGETTTIIGPSGSGKSTLLLCVAGLESYTGKIEVDGHCIAGPRPDIATVFQAPHLLPWRTTLANVEYGLELQRVPPMERKQRAERLLELVGLTSARNLYPAQLSGGMQQRANIARALAVEPHLLLMDEPFGALDAITKEYLQEEFQALVARQQVTTVFITHDIAEAIYLGNRVVVLSANPGRVLLEQTVEEPRPRPLEWKQSESFQKLSARLWQALRVA
ncbi:MAG: ABC transporter ATP-binding protein [Acidimicrobiaceae bacterium]|nr:ABC transporter ATP-binding protein [Acidimicrobiaceae bacterium]